MNDEEYSHMMAQLGTSEVFAEEDGEDEISSFSLPKANLVEKKTTRNFKLTNEDIKILEQIVEAEATGEDIIGKILVANVIFNRMESEEFPDTVKEVVFQKVGDKYQFSPIADKRYWQVEVSEETREAVKRAISGEDYSQGALYFMARKLARKSSIKWFDSNLELLFKHGEHEFFK
ncbi:MAG: cell wall hydrolase [Clostridiales bacterium]|nr:cell wall hydrolase [Clostridiales bacterium]